jgi:hypothetical protein
VHVINPYNSAVSSNALLTLFEPPVLTVRLLAGYPLLSLYGTPTSNYMVQSNADLSTSNWGTVHVFSPLPASPGQFIDPIPPGATGRFYRAVGY